MRCCLGTRVKSAFAVLFIGVVLMTIAYVSTPVEEVKFLKSVELNAGDIQKHASRKFVIEEADGSLNVVFHIPSSSRLVRALKGGSTGTYSTTETKNDNSDVTGNQTKTGSSSLGVKNASDTSTTTTTTTAATVTQSTQYPLSISDESPYLINNENICKGFDNITYLTVVHTATDHFQRRSNIRETWANENIFENYTTKLVFLLGMPQKRETQTLIDHESETHGDIVQGNFLDTYHNLTHKGVLGYRWITEYCPQAQRILKVDDDIFVNSFKLLDVLVTNRTNDQRKIYCSLRKNGTSPIMRGKGKWKVDDHEFPNLKFFPVPYCNGFFAILTTDIIKEMYEAAKRTPFFWVDDVYLFGLLPQNIGNVTFVHEPSTGLKEKKVMECFTGKDKCNLYAGTSLKRDETNKLWYSAMKQYSELVRKYAPDSLLTGLE